jgi:glyoxylase-like metal-dependent hydrolase (beta-lactamase superfamily II)
LVWQIGDIRIARIWELDCGPLDPLRWFPDATRKHLAQIGWLHPAFVDANGAIVLSIPVILIEMPNRRILVDTGLGTLPLPGFPVLRRSAVSARQTLAAMGTPPDRIDTVIHTHLHADHVGGDTIGEHGHLQAAYPRARFVIQRREFDYWRGQKPDSFGGMVFARTVGPLARQGSVDLVDGTSNIAPGIALVPSPGHTPGHMSVRVASQGKEALITGDMIHHPLQLAYPDRGMDLDEKQGAATRRALLSDAADRKVLMIGTHFPSPAAGLVVRDGSAFRLES